MSGREKKSINKPPTKKEEKNEDMPEKNNDTDDIERPQVVNNV